MQETPFRPLERERPAEVGMIGMIVGMMNDRSRLRQIQMIRKAGQSALKDQCLLDERLVSISSATRAITWDLGDKKASLDRRQKPGSTIIEGSVCV
jgi:hypothetical protein